MAKGYDANKERQDAISLLGKQLAKRAGFTCEWCASKNDLRPWDCAPHMDPAAEHLVLLCGRCRFLADGGSGDEQELYALRNALWSDLPAIAGGAARVLARHRVSWGRDAIEESLLPEEIKQGLLRGW